MRLLYYLAIVGITVLASGDVIGVDMLKDADFTEVQLKNDSLIEKPGSFRILRTSDAVINLDASSKMDSDDDEFMDVDHMIDITKDSEETPANEEKNSEETNIILTSTVDTESFERTPALSSTTETPYMASSELPDTETPETEKELPRLSSSSEVLEAREQIQSASPNDVAVGSKNLGLDPIEPFVDIPKTSRKTSVSSTSQESDYLSSSETTTKSSKSSLYPISQSTTTTAVSTTNIPEVLEVTTASGVVTEAATLAPKLLVTNVTVQMTAEVTKPRKQKTKEIMKITKTTKKPVVQKHSTSASVLRSTAIETSEPRITIPIPTDKEFDWTIVSSTLQTDLGKNEDNTLVRYFVKFTKSPFLKLKKKIAKTGYTKETTTPMQMTASGVTATTGSAVGEQIFVPIGKDNSEKPRKGSKGESAVTIPVADVFRETFAPSEHTTPSSMDGENSVDPFEITSSTSKTSPSQKPMKTETIAVDKPVSSVMKYSTRPFSVKETKISDETLIADAEDASDDKHSNISLPEILLSHDSSPSSEKVNNEVFPGDSKKNFKDILNPAGKFSELGSALPSELKYVHEHTPLTQKLHSSDIPAHGFTQAHGVVVSHTPKTPKPTQSGIQEKLSELQSVKGNLVPVVPSVFPKRLKELPDASRAFQEESATVSNEVKNDKSIKKVEGSSEASQLYDEIKGLELVDGDVKAFWNTTLASSRAQPTEEHYKSHSFGKKSESELQGATGTRSSNELSKKYHEILEEQKARLSAALQEILDSFVRNATLPSTLHVKPKIPPSPPLATSEAPLPQAYTTTKVVTVKPVPTPMSGSTRKRKVDELLAPAKQSNHGAGELWWTPRPSFHGKTIGSPDAYTTKRPQSYRRKFKATSSSISDSDYAKSLRTDVNRIQYTPLATATAVGQSNYNRTQSQHRLTTHQPVRVKDAHPKTATSMRIPENHLQILQGELEMLTTSTTAFVEPQTLAAPVDRAMFGKPRRIVHTRRNNLFLPTILSAPNKRIVKKLIKTKKASNKRNSIRITNPLLEAEAFVEDQATEKAVTDALVESGIKEDTIATSQIVKREPEVSGALSATTQPKASSSSPLIKISRREDINADTDISETQMKSMVANDMDELEMALKEIAQMSEHNGIVTSFFGDYKDTPQPAESGTAKSNLKKQTNPKVNRDANAQLEVAGLKPGKGTISTSFRLIAPPPPLDSDVVRTPGMHSVVEKMTDAAKHNSSKLVVPKLLCFNITCDFENGNLCGFDPAPLSMTVKEKRKSRAKRAIVDSSYFELRRWSIWVGNFSKSNKRVDQAPVFSPMNRRFVASLLSGQQMATMSMRVMTSEPISVTFDGWEATQQMLMRACCDSKCPLTTYFDVLSTDRSWRLYSMNCPANTHTITFECLNFGNRRGACGIDNFNAQSQSCTNKPTNN